MRTKPTSLSAAVGLGLFAALFLLLQGIQPCDDAYITFRHARNLALAGRPAWNLEGAPVLGSTSPLFVLALGGLGAAVGAGHIETTALVLNALALAVVVVLGYAIARDLFAGELAALLAGALIGFNSVIVFVSSLGFESTSFTALLLGSLYAVRRGRDLVAVVLASAAPLLRPEGILVTPLVWGSLLLSGRLRARLVAAYLLLPALWVAFAIGYYGSPLPQSVWAKRMTPAVYRPYEKAEVELGARLGRLAPLTAAFWRDEAEGLLFSSSLDGGEASPGARAAAFATKWISLAGLAVLCAVLLRRRDGRGLYLLYPPLFLLFFAWLGRAEVWYFPSFVACSLLLLFAGCAHAIALASGRLGRSGARAEPAALIALFLLLSLASRYAVNRGERADPAKSFVYAEDPRGVRWQRWERERFEGYREAARFLGAQGAPHAPALISEVGVFGYFYPGPVIDAVGLCSPEALAFYPPPEADIYDARGHYRTGANTIIPTALVSALEPTYLVSSAIYIPHLLRPKSPFLATYALLTRSGEAWARPILVFERRAPQAPGWFESDGGSAFSGQPGPRGSPPYDVVATDMDLDGDTDLLVNWHHLEPLELYENEGGSFRRVNPPGHDHSGLFDDRDIPSLYADAAEMARRLGPTPPPGLHLWHDVDRRGSWHFVWRTADGPARLEVEANDAVVELEGLEPGELERRDPRALRIDLPDGARPRSFRLRLAHAGTQLKLRLHRDGPGAPPSLFVGAEQSEIPGGAVELWQTDPHGMAWVQAEGTRPPELFVTRGGLMGTLAPPLDPKLDRYYVHDGDEGLLYHRAPAGIVPPDYARGRRVEWVDLEGDGRLELSITAYASPNRLLARASDASPFEDRAAALGLDLDPDVGAWGDLDDDGLPDFFYLTPGSVDVAHNRGGKRFEIVSGTSLGLVLPDERQETNERHTALRWADFDADGDLDLFVLRYGVRGSHHLFLREGAGFRDVSQRVGLAGLRGRSVSVLGDFDDDGFVDVASFGLNVARGGEGGRPRRSPGLLWRNLRGERFELGELPVDSAIGNVDAATSLDADGDGRTDLVLVGKGGRRLLRNVTREGFFLDVVLRDGEREPIGAVVRAFYADGRIVAQRYGSAHNTAFSQALQPLRFGMGERNAIQRVGVRWPGERNEAVTEVSGANTTLVIERER